MKRYVLRYGLISGAIMIAIGLINWFFFADAIGYHASEIVGYASMIAGLMCVPLAIKYYRDQLNQGQASLKEGMKIGMGVSLIASIMMFFQTTIFFALAWDDFMAWYERSVSQEEWAAAREQMATMPDYMFTPWFNGVLLFFTVLIIGFIITLISSLLLKSSDKTMNA